MVSKRCAALLPLALLTAFACREPSVFNENADAMAAQGDADATDSSLAAAGNDGAAPSGSGGLGGDSRAGGSTAPGSGGIVGCIPKPEECFNKADDDCDTKVDCADEDCGPQARCVPSAGAEFSLGVSVGASEDCPAGYAEPVTVKRGLRSAGDCEGCSCTVSDTKCEVQLATYQTAGDCNAESNASLAAPADGNYGSCNWLLNGGGAINGAKVLSVTPSASCDVKGTAKPKALEWIETLKFCKRATTPLGGGCGSEQVCVAKADAPACILRDGEHVCPQPYASAHSWFLSATDTRSCSACGCAVKGGACPLASVNVYSGYNCNSSVEFSIDTVRAKVCADIGYGSVARYGGQVEAATCASSAQVASGGATPTGPTAFCCVP